MVGLLLAVGSVNHCKLPMRPRAGRENTCAPCACTEGEDVAEDEWGDATTWAPPNPPVPSCPRGLGCGNPHVLDVVVVAVEVAFDACCCLEGNTQCTAQPSGPAAAALSALLSLPPLAQAWW